MNTSDEESTSTNEKITKSKSTHNCNANCNCSASQKRPMNAFLIFCNYRFLNFYSIYNFIDLI